MIQVVSYDSLLLDRDREPGKSWRERVEPRLAALWQPARSLLFPWTLSHPRRACWGSFLPLTSRPQRLSQPFLCPCSYKMPWTGVCVLENRPPAPCWKWTYQERLLLTHSPCGVRGPYCPFPGGPPPAPCHVPLPCPLPPPGHPQHTVPSSRAALTWPLAADLRLHFWGKECEGGLGLEKVLAVLLSSSVTRVQARGNLSLGAQGARLLLDLGSGISGYSLCSGGRVSWHLKSTSPMPPTPALNWG